MFEFREEGIRQVATEGHRSYVGGNDQYWDEIGRLQFEFLLKNGLTEDTSLLDIGCGSLRGGCLFINFLAEKNYLGIDKELSLIILGVANELGIEAYLEKKPEFVISAEFEFVKFSRIPTMAIAQSLFTHLTLDDIGICLKNLREFVHKGFVLFATYFPSETLASNPSRSHSHACFHYTVSEIWALAQRAGFEFENIGDWGHPRGQHIAAFKKL
ncbi:hypothetical protein [Nitrosovibrio sp. Nv4]|uniref:hypothetical protein n=1 Tax=Nitrosovibrio sp. Nv4 TaxID=1945880 RepID=UPI000BC6F157|nr:hypothetical protein [Nitrosovibrio sp. Nv4]SOD39851.1 hypothetical protein SAMN06298226_0082 [Nitrosovibrio sp. Nv4]